jgi:N-acetylmuramoyl-L-alanine amidase
MQYDEHFRMFLPANKKRSTPSHFPEKLKIFCRPATLNFWDRVLINTIFAVGIILSSPLLFLVQAQTDLERISVAVRGDGRGYVIRLHTTSEPRRFTVVQPETNLLQFTFNGSRVRTTNLTPNPVPPIKDIIVTDTDEGTGIDFYLNDGEFYSASTYMDANGRHVLIALTRISEPEALRIAARTERIPRGTEPVAGSETDHSESGDPDLSVVPVEPVIPDAPLTGSVSDPVVAGQDTPDPEDAFDRLFNQRRTLKFEVVVIDPGHGGREPGSIGTRGTREKDVTLQVAKRIGAYINEYLPEIKVVYTREDDRFVDLPERGRIANRVQGDLFISIHANSVRGRSAYGTEVWVLGMHRTQEAFEVMKQENSVIQFENNDDTALELTQEQLMIYELANSGNMASSVYFAELLDRQFSQRAGRRSRGVKQAGFQVLYHASMPAVLVELGFISNPNEERFITSDYGQSILASAIFRAVRDYKEQIERSQKERDTR